MRVTYHPKASVDGNQSMRPRYRPGRHTQPMFLAPGSKMVECGEDGGAGHERDRPADHAPEHQNHETQLVCSALDHPGLDLMAENNHEGGQGQGKQRDRHKQQRANAPAPEAPIVNRQTIGAAKTLP